MTTKIHAVVDGLGNPLRLQISSGNSSDFKHAQTMLEGFELSGKYVIADKGYDSKDIVRYITERGGRAIIPSISTRKEQRTIDFHMYKERHLVEKLFLKMKNYRRLATRYEKTAESFIAVTQLAAILIWLM